MSEPFRRAEGEAGDAGRTAGIALAVGSLLMVAFMMLHPRIEAHGTTEFIAEVERQAIANGIVHGSLIALLGLFVFGFTGLESRLGMSSAFGRAGLVAYVMGAIALAAAALINGFIVPEFVSRYQARPAEELLPMHDILALCRASNQVCSRMGVLAMSIAIVLWSIPLVGRRGLLRLTGVLGCIAGALPALALLSGHLPMNVHGVLAFVLAQAVWNLAIAFQLIRNRV
jgi:hypothetical protein